jgi:farnesyl diphosphate synthase
MDDDDIRRGVPSCHKKFDEATAILAGDALLTFAFEILVSPATHGNATIRCELVKTIARASGFRGMAGGQMIDLEKSGQKISNQELTKLHRLKTAELFMAAAEAGAILGEASDEERKELRYFADDLGLAFQIKDDISDQELAEVKDVQEQLNSLRNQAIARLKIFGARAALLVELMNFVVDAAQT